MPKKIHKKEVEKRIVSKPSKLALVMDFELIFDSNGYFKQSSGIIRRRVYNNKLLGDYIIYKDCRVQVSTQDKPILPKLIYIDGERP